MPTLACRTCGRRLTTRHALEALSREARRCPRCGAPLAIERRLHQRRQVERRQNPPDDPGPPPGTGERRRSERRSLEPRRRNRFD